MEILSSHKNLEIVKEYSELKDVDGKLHTFEDLGFVVADGHITRLVLCFQYFDSIRKLWVGNFEKRLERLPECFGDLIYLKELNLMHNNLSNLPESFKNLRKLQDLNLSNNNINDIQFLSTLLDLNNLQELDLGKNQISELDSLSDLTNFNKLNLRQNQISILKIRKVYINLNY